MLPIDDAVLCRYQYDPLDRMAGSSPAGADSVQRFYQRNCLATEIQGPVRRAVFQTAEQLLAQHESGGAQDTRVLLATDQQRSVLLQVEAAQNTAKAYTAYGFGASLGDLPGFNGEQPGSVTGHYLLGNGYRAFNPVLMRFNSPDSLSPFGKGGLNAYAYCAGDPVNRVDPTGHMFSVLKGVLKVAGVMKKTTPLLSSSPVRTVRPATNIKILDKAVYKFEEVLSRGKTRVTFDAHGSRGSADEYSTMAAGGRELTPDHLAYLAEMSGVDFERFDKVRLLMCHSATQGASSFAAEFSAIIGKPVQGFRGVVSASLDQHTMIELINKKSTEIRRLSDGSYHYDKGIHVVKESPFAPGDPRFTYINYQPRTIHMTHL